jgi:predicted lipoprotein with Yx(FWY)xxD motif
MFFLLSLLAVAVLIFGCIGSEGGTKAPNTTNTTTQQQPNVTQPAAAATPVYTINVMSNAMIGSYLVDGNGITLYYKTTDSASQSNGVTGAILATWPVFYSASIVVPSSLNAADFGSFTRADNGTQTTYMGWPLYYYTLDKAIGDAKGQAVGGIWFAAKPTLTQAPSAG